MPTCGTEHAEDDSMFLAIFQNRRRDNNNRAGFLIPSDFPGRILAPMTSNQILLPRSPAILFRHNILCFNAPEPHKSGNPDYNGQDQGCQPDEKGYV